MEGVSGSVVEFYSARGESKLDQDAKVRDAVTGVPLSNFSDKEITNNVTAGGTITYTVTTCFYICR